MTSVQVWTVCTRGCMIVAGYIWCQQKPLYQLRVSLYQTRYSDLLAVEHSTALNTLCLKVWSLL